MKLYKTKTAVVVEFEDQFYECPKAVFGALIQRDDLFKILVSYCVPEHRIDNDLKALLKQVLPPIDQQEVWAAGVTYYRSKTARMEESKDSGGSSFYDRVYEAARPELFFKSTAARVVGHKALVRIRKDSHWSVPEPELTLLISPNKKIIGYTVGNDMSARDIEGENPLYLPQAKSYTGAAAIFCSAIKNDTPPLIYEDGNQRRDFIHVRDLVRGKLLLLDHPDANDDIFNIGTGKPSSILDLAETLIELCGKNFSSDIIYKFRNGDIRDCYADISKIKALGFAPELSLREGLKDLIAWSDSQEAVSRVGDAHQKLVEKGLVLETQPVTSK